MCIKQMPFSYVIMFLCLVIILMLVVCSRTFLSIVGGVVAGILGLTSITGFLFYFIIMMITSAAVTVKAGFNINKFFDSWNRVTIDGLTAGLMVCFSFIMFNMFSAF